MNGDAASSQHPPTAFTLHEAAAMLGVSLNTLRRRIDAGQIRAERVSRPQGHVWRVYLDAGQRSDQHAEQDAGSTLPQPPGDVLRAEAMATYTRSLLEPLVNRLAEQERTIRELAEELGRLRERVATFEAPTSHQTREASNLTAHAPDPSRGPSGPPSPAPIEPMPNGQEHVPWWRRWWAFGLL
jgi:excisionase family DNA binding protein